MKLGYKQTEMGVIPEEWDAEKLGNFVSLQRGHDLTWRVRRPGDVPVMGSAGQNGFHDMAIAKGPGVVLGRSGASFGQAHYCEKDFWPHNTALYVTDFRGNDPLFVFYVLKSTDFTRHNSGGAQQSLNRNFIYPIPVAVPRPIEQRVIAGALSDVDALIGALDSALAKKRDLKQAAMQQLLTGETRLPGFHGEWEDKRLGDVLKVRHGKSQHGVVVAAGMYPILATGGEIGRTNQYLHNKPSVLIGRKGTIDAPQYVETPFWSIDTLFFTEISAEASAKFIFYKFNMINWRSYNEASGVPSLNASTIEGIEVRIPKFVEQIAIAEVLSDIDAELTALTQRRDKTRALKQGMMQELLTGRTRLV